MELDFVLGCTGIMRVAVRYLQSFGECIDHILFGGSVNFDDIEDYCGSSGAVSVFEIRLEEVFAVGFALDTAALWRGVCNQHAAPLRTMK